MPITPPGLMLPLIQGVTALIPLPSLLGCVIGIEHSGQWKIFSSPAITPLTPSSASAEVVWHEDESILDWDAGARPALDSTTPKPEAPVWTQLCLGVGGSLAESGEEAHLRGFWLMISTGVVLPNIVYQAQLCCNFGTYLPHLQDMGMPMLGLLFTHKQWHGPDANGLTWLLRLTRASLRSAWEPGEKEVVGRVDVKDTGEDSTDTGKVFAGRVLMCNPEGVLGRMCILDRRGHTSGEVTATNQMWK
ncbi:hypothetical protein FB451DRAFT_1195790 [Mycena latifolia]|nr:hypothetical protein FB451DRAFT_1195790 [Mycena latifolia]